MAALLRKELLEQWRTYRLLSVAAVLTIFGLLSPALARYTPELLKSLPGVPANVAGLIPAPTVADAVGQYLKNAMQFGWILALLVPMGSVAAEKERGTAAMLLSKPVTLPAFLLSKFAALGVTFLAGVALGALVAYYYTGLLFTWMDFGRFMLLNGFLWLYLLAHIALAFFSSALARSQLQAAGLAFVLFALLGVIGVIPPAARYLPGELTNWGAALVLGVPADPAWGALAVTLGLVAAALAGAWAVLRRQEI